MVFGEFLGWSAACLLAICMYDSRVVVRDVKGGHLPHGPPQGAGPHGFNQGIVLINAKNTSILHLMLQNYQFTADNFQMVPDERVVPPEKYYLVWPCLGFLFIPPNLSGRLGVGWRERNRNQN